MCWCNSARPYLLACNAIPWGRGWARTGRRVACSNNLKDIALALHDYHRANGCFPPAYIADKTGKPMHSWRVLILPYLDRNDLYKAYDFTEPWDGPKNKRLLAKCPQIYLCPSDPPASISVRTPTSYVAVVGPRAAWEGEKPRKLGDFPGETSNTIMLVEVADPHIPWTEPRDLSLDTLGVTDAKSPPLVVSSYHGQREEFFFTYDRATGINVALADYGVRCWWLGNRSTEDLRKLLQIGGFTDKESEETERHLNWPNIAALAVWLLPVGTLLTCRLCGAGRSSQFRCRHRSRGNVALPAPPPRRWLLRRIAPVGASKGLAGPAVCGFGGMVARGVDIAVYYRKRREQEGQ